MCTGLRCIQALLGSSCEYCVQDEILEVAGKIYKAGMSLLVIDTENKFVSTGFAKEIAKIAQGLFTHGISLIGFT